MGLESVELLIVAEEEFGIVISDAEATQIRTPSDFIDLIVSKVQGRVSRPEIAGRIKQIIVETLGIKESEYREDADFVRDLRMG
jgi:acyl carrier protein